MDYKRNPISLLMFWILLSTFAISLPHVLNFTLNVCDFISSYLWFHPQRFQFYPSCLWFHSKRFQFHCLMFVISPSTFSISLPHVYNFTLNVCQRCVLVFKWRGFPFNCNGFCWDFKHDLSQSVEILGSFFNWMIYKHNRRLEQSKRRFLHYLLLPFHRGLLNCEAMIPHPWKDPNWVSQQV